MNLLRFWNEIWTESTIAEETAHTMADEQFSSNNFYEILGVEPNSSQNEIKRKLSNSSFKGMLSKNVSHIGALCLVSYQS